MADIGVRLYGPAALTTSAATKYTVPGSTTTFVRHVLFTNTTANDRTATLSIGADATNTRLFGAIPVPANGVVPIDLWQIMSAGEIIQAFADANAAVNLTISGIESA